MARPPAKRTPPAKPPKAAPQSGHGGQRKGAGRKVSVIPPDVRDRVGRYPFGQPFKIARFYQDLIGGLLDHVLDGSKGLTKLLAEVKSASAAANRIIPLDVMHAAAQGLERDDKDMKEIDSGAQVTSRKEDSGAQRVSPVRRATP
jgi:hypothetical protein